MTFLSTKFVFKDLFRNQYIKIRKLVRRPRPKPNLMDALLLLIEKTEASRESEGRTNSTLAIDGQYILIPAIRGDGVGIQAMIRICVMFLAWQAKVTYVHLPFLKLAHQNIDPAGRSLTTEEWAAKWEEFFNLGKDEFDITDLANAIGEENLAQQLSAKDRHFGDPQDELRDALPTMLENIRGRDSGASGIYTFDLGVCRQPRECNMYLDGEFIQILKEKFETNGYRPEEMLYDEQYLNIAIHIRRGDVWDAIQAGSNRVLHKNKLVTEEYYVGLLHRLQNSFTSSSRPVRYHIFSDGQADNFGKFTFTSAGEAFLESESGNVIENIQFHLRESAFDTLYHMINAPILVPGKSTFSVVAVLLGDSYVLYENEVTEFYQYDLLEKYIEGNPRFISLTGLEDRDVDVMQATRD